MTFRNTVAATTHNLSPLSAGLILAGGLLFAIVVIVRAVTAPAQPVTPIVVAPANQPALTLERQGGFQANSSRPADQPASRPAADNGWFYPERFAVMPAGISRMVWADAWFDCWFVDASTATYRPVGMGTPPNRQDAIDVGRWNTLPVSDQWKIVEVCNGE